MECCFVVLYRYRLLGNTIGVRSFPPSLARHAVVIAARPVVFFFHLPHLIRMYVDRFDHELCFKSFEACFRLQLHSSYALPAPNPAPRKVGHALRLKRRTEKTTPKPRPREDFMIRLERQRSHCRPTLSAYSNIYISTLFYNCALGW